MARINLLPWREELKKEKQKEFGVTIGVTVFLMAIALGGVHVYFAGKISHQNDRNQLLEREIATVEAKIKEIQQLEKKKRELVARIKVIEDLQSNRSSVVYLLEEMVKAVPEGLLLSSLKQDGNRLEINGDAESNARVSTFMRSLESSDWFGEPILDGIVSQNDGRSFKLIVGMKAGNLEEKEE